MADYEAFRDARSPVSRGSGRDRGDDYRSEPYRDRRRSPIAGRYIDTRNRAALAYRRKDRRRPDRGDRRRSRSPRDSRDDRYEREPRGARDDYRDRRDDRDYHGRERRRSSPQPIDRYIPGHDAPPPQLLVNPLPDPMKLDFQWWRTEQRIKEEKERARTGRPPARIRGDRETKEEREAERPKIQAAYDAYKENLQRVQAQTFVRLHKGEDWFRERYVAENRDTFRARLMQFRKSLFAQWEQDLAGGVFDDFTLEGIYKSESNGLGGTVEKEEGEAAASAEVLGVGDLLPSKGGELRDPVSLQPTLLIKTIAPTVTREKFEEFAKEHLGEGEGGYRHLSLSDPNPLKKCHRMGWIMLHPESEPAKPKEQHESDKAEGGENGEAPASENALTAVRPLQPQSTSDKALAKINGKTIEDPERGNFTVHCGVHRPPDAPRKKALWDLFSAPERIARDLELATRLVRKLDNELGDEYFGVAKIEQRVQELAEAGNLQPAASSKPPKDLNMDADDAEEGEAEDEGQLEEDDTDDEELLIKKKKLDLLVEYLRRVYNLCFFCVFESDSVHELQRKCPGGHLRRPRASLTSTAKDVARASANGEEFPLRKNGTKKDSAAGEGEDADTGAMDNGSPVDERKPAGGLKPSMKNAQQLQRAYNWVKTFEEKILQWLEPDNVNVRKIGGVPAEEGVDQELNKFVLQEDASKYRCKVPECTKLFKGVDFWRKHVEKRHPEFYQNIVENINLVNTYVLDPAHIAPSRSDANSNGHFPLNNHMPTGTPRGFQLSQQFPIGFPMAAGMNGAGGMPVVAPGFNPAMMAGAMAGHLGGGVGPMRTMGGGRNNTFINGAFVGGGRMPGPYMRNDARGMRGVGGAMAYGPGMQGTRGMGMSSGMEGGAGAMGPREAVAGRQLRSYEDLDADKGQDTKELDY
ncbi:arsenite-resistance protein 2 [Teratosphaeria destructans]|uniref:Arsenite-resistance protein 2 n=1 Tax=Teratosphaeria destructans TaxID=418781 RepID=A0A9W7SJI6_9PEZI|nr:arsenite-resistance protein 2 [Teratosphaeria destructans]